MTLRQTDCREALFWAVAALVCACTPSNGTGSHDGGSDAGTSSAKAGFQLGAVSGPTTEAGGTATFTLVLNSQPSADVTVNFQSSLASEGVTDVTQLTFTSANWNTPQTVTVTGVDDALQDGPHAYTVDFSATTSTDTGYAG